MGIRTPKQKKTPAIIGSGPSFVLRQDGLRTVLCFEIIITLFDKKFKIFLRNGRNDVTIQMW